MNTTAQQLAEALRAVTGTPPRADYSGNPDPFGVYAALADYDAQQAATPTPGTLSDTGKQTLETIFRELQMGKIFRPDDVRHAWAHAQMCVNAHDALVSALQGVMPYVENEVSSILELADDGDEHADEECEAATAALEAARAALASAGASHA